MSKTGHIISRRHYTKRRRASPPENLQSDGRNVWKRIHIVVGRKLTRITNSRDFLVTLPLNHGMQHHCEDKRANIGASLYKMMGSIGDFMRQMQLTVSVPARRAYCQTGLLQRRQGRRHTTVHLHCHLHERFFILNGHSLLGHCLRRLRDE